MLIPPEIRLRETEKVVAKLAGVSIMSGRFYAVRELAL
jgi:hypothetical protein